MYVNQLWREWKWVLISLGVLIWALLLLGLLVAQFRGV
jgi:hypothetical protein